MVGVMATMSMSLASAQAPKPLAWVNGSPVYEEQVNAEMNRQLQRQASDPEQITAASVLEQLIDERLLAQQAASQEKILQNDFFKMTM